jgi:hypothetical protein
LVFRPVRRRGDDPAAQAKASTWLAMASLACSGSTTVRWPAADLGALDDAAHTWDLPRCLADVDGRPKRTGCGVTPKKASGATNTH